MSRVDRITHTSKKREFYSDVPMNFDKSPITQSLSRLTNERSVVQSIKNLVRTGKGERFFQPEVGGNVNALLFDPVDSFTADAIQTLVSQTISNWEKRVDANVSVTENGAGDGYDVTIQYSLLNNPSESFTINFFLSRVR